MAGPRFFGATASSLAATLLAIGNADAFSSHGGISHSALVQVPRIIRAQNASRGARRRRVLRPLQAEADESDGLSVQGGADNSNSDNSSDCPESLDVATPLPLSSWKRLVRALPSVQRKKRDDGSKHPFKVQFGDDLDKQILGTALPSMINLAVVPVVNSVDTYWVGRLGSALALAGQAAANQAFFTLYFLIAFLPNITAPLVASAVSAGDEEAAQSRVCESLFLSNLLGGIGTLLLVGMPTLGLSLVLDKSAPAMEYAAPYLRLRALSMIPALFSATGFAAYRGLLNTVTPLKVSLVTNLLNLLADPIAIFGLPALGWSKGMGVAGAALATAGSELTGGLIYLKLLLRRNLVKMSRLFKAPAWKDLKPLLQGGLAMLARQATLNVAFLTATRRAQSMDPTGVAAASYGIVMQIYSVGVVAHLAIQGTAAALVPSAKAASGDDAARAVADRMFLWGTIVGVLLAGTQLALLPKLVPMFSTLTEVQEAVKTPALISCFLHILNGPVFAGEGTMLGLSKFKALASLTALGVSAMVAGIISPLGKRLDGILLSLAAFCAAQAIGVLVYHVRIGPLRRRGFRYPFTSGLKEA
jgi:putative MATE family efflux protein